jgi:hypothetical protein
MRAATAKVRVIQLVVEVMIQIEVAEERVLELSLLIILLKRLFAELKRNRKRVSQGIFIYNCLLAVSGSCVVNSP